jgi:L-malate glycosyltransferase
MTHHDRIRVLQFITDFRFGGTERQFVMLGKHLDPARFETRVACIRRSGDYFEEIERQGLPVSEYCISSLHDLNSVKHRLRFARYLRRHRIQVVLAYGFYPNVFAIPAARIAGTPVILASVRDTGDLYSRGQKWVQKQVCRLASRIVVNAEANVRWLVADGYRPERIALIRNGVDLSRFHERTDGAALRSRFGLPPGAPIVAMVARLSFIYGADSKGTMDYLRAAAIVVRRFPQARFLMVGDGASRPMLQREAERLGLTRHLVFTGFRSDVPEILSGVDISVLPSRLMESTSNTLLESMAAGVPVVATRFGGTPEVVAEGETALLVTPARPGELAAAIGSLLADPPGARRMGEAGRRRAVELFSLERMVRQTETLFERTLEEATRRRPSARVAASVRS